MQMQVYRLQLSGKKLTATKTAKLLTELSSVGFAVKALPLVKDWCDENVSVFYLYNVLDSDYPLQYLTPRIEQALKIRKSTGDWSLRDISSVIACELPSV